MVYDFQACAVQVQSGLLVRMRGMLPSSAHRIDVAGYYPGTIIFITDPGYALINLASRVEPGPGLQVLTRWEQTLPLKSTHAQVRIALDNAILATIQVEPGFVVAAETGGINPSNAYHIFPADQPILGIYSLEFGPASRSWCEEYVRLNTSGIRSLRPSHSSGDHKLSLASGGGEIPVPYRTSPGEHPWPFGQREASITTLAGRECVLADAESIAASQTADLLTILARVWTPSTAWHPVITRSMLAVEPPTFILSRCRMSPQGAMKMTLVDIEQTFHIGTPRKSIKVVTEKGIRDVEVKAGPTALAQPREGSEPNSSARQAIGYSKQFKFDEALQDALRQLDAKYPPSPTYTSTRVDAIGTEHGGFTGVNTMYVVVSRVI
jgi:hypothetical protein